ncbi:MAG: aminotransferase class III-fold pyridoxal phosphate-dependent enzyme [Alphaproteobacteria bacterium]|nr:aminotransferase class III-fold pyridoxal phosphate-dependent enzyme [Alphaproteobacteria bacterium]
MRTVAIIQARMASSRLPGKALADIAGRAMVDRVLDRTGAAGSLDAIWLATSDQATDDGLAAHVEALGTPVFRGEEDDVLGRTASAARAAQADAIVRVTADCPMIDPSVIDRIVERFHRGDVDFASNTLTRTYPDGLDTEVFSRAALDRADAEVADPLLRLHVTPWISGVLGERCPNGGFTTANVCHGVDFSHLRWCVDDDDDLDFMRRAHAALPAEFGWLDVLALVTAAPALLRINRRHDMWEGVDRDRARLAGADRPQPCFQRSNMLLNRALKTIPLGSQTFSKSHQTYVRGAAPLFVERGHGCRVRDVDGNMFIDYVLGLLPVVLGYCDPDVDAAIQDQLERGITFSLPTELECDLAERLVGQVPCAEMARFGKNGSDATSAAIRLARAHTGRDRIAVCGYHGWHDWYIGTTSRDLGVPAAVKALTATFPYNDADSLAQLLATDSDGYAAVILEPHGLLGPEPGFLETVRALTERHGTVLIFDEIVSGFRIDPGGAQAAYGVTPDLATFGKALANGMPISAVVGRAALMRRMEEIFFSTTFGGEALSLAAAIATLDKMAASGLAACLARRGRGLIDGANAALARNGLAGLARFGGGSWWPILEITAPEAERNLLVSLLRQEFAANGLLIAASLNLCLAHDDDKVERETLEAMDRSFTAVRDALESPDPAGRLRGAPVKATFAVRGAQT